MHALPVQQWAPASAGQSFTCSCAATSLPSREEQQHRQQQHRTCIIGAGAAGLSAAWGLAQSGRHHVEVWEADGHVGGVAGTVTMLPDGKSWFNDQAQVGFPKSYPCNLLLMEQFGMKPRKAWPGLNISVLGRDNQRWDNYTAGATFPVLQKHCAEIERFVKLMEQLVLGKLQLLQFVPIGWLLRLWRFSDEFKQDVVYPIVGSFNGTGGSMDATPAAVTASALMHPAFKIFQADRRTMLAPATSGPEVFIFPNLRNLYDTMAEELRLKGTTICLGRPVDSLHFVGQHGSTSDRWLVKSQGQEGVFDSVILACPGRLGAQNTARQRCTGSLEVQTATCSAMLGAIDYADVPIITHTDVDYLRQNYHVSISQDYNTTPFWMVRHADGGPGRGTELELSYACLTVDEAGQAGPTRVCQTNFRMDADLDDSKIVHRRNARHMRTTAANFVRTVLFSRIAQGHNGAFLCGAYLFGNPHEAANIGVRSC